MSAKGSYNSEQFSNFDNENDRLKSQGQNQQKFERDFLRSVGLKPEDNILELGPGPGHISKILLSLINRGSLTCLEYSKDFIDLWKRNMSDLLKEQNTKAKIYQGDVRHLPEDFKNFDFCYARFILQHISNPQKAIEECFNSLSATGTLLIVDADDSLLVHYPANKKLSEFLTKVQDKQAEYGGDRNFGRKAKSLLNQTGFTKVKTQVITWTSDQIPLETLLDISLGYKSTLLGKPDDFIELKKELLELNKINPLFFSTGIVATWGERP